MYLGIVRCLVIGCWCAFNVMSVADRGFVSTASHFHGRVLVDSPLGLALEDSWVLEVSGGRCPSVLARIEAWRIANQTVTVQARVTRIHRKCWIVLDGPRALVTFLLKHVPYVLLVEPNVLVRTARYMSGDPPSWGLNRVDQPDLPLSSGYAFSESFDGSNQSVYVLDTGINEHHDEFVTWCSPMQQSGRRSRLGGDFVNEPNTGDGHGHGTHCAGTAAGGSYGIARGASVIGVKVLGADGSGPTSAVLEGLAWATRDSAGKSAVISLSLGSASSAALDSAVRAAANAGMVIVAAAGNSAKDACKYSPARVGGRARTTGVITVGATDREDTRAWFSNYGKCVDIFAPGVAIYSAWTGTNSATRYISGTSQATPHVAGTMAVLLQKHAGNRGAALTELFAIAVTGKVKGPRGANRLLQVPRPAIPTAQSSLRPSMPPTVEMPSICAETVCADSGFSAAIYGPIFSRDSTHVSGLLAVASTDLCSPSPARFFSGKIVLVARGNCLFYQKTIAAQMAGAKALIIYMTDNSDPFPPNYSGAAIAPKIMTFMIYKNDGLALAWANGQMVIIGIKQSPKLRR
jgi:hypothetical protein